MKNQLFALLAVCASPFVQSGEINVDTPAQGLALFNQESFNIQCWQEGQKVLDEQGQGAISSTAEFAKPRLVFQQVDKDKRVMIMTLGRSLCMIKST